MRVGRDDGCSGGDVTRADLRVRIAAKLGGLALLLVSRLTRRKDAITYADQLSEGLRRLR